MSGFLIVLWGTMIRTKDVLNCLPLVASILGDRYGVQVRIGGKDACTNGKVIFLPSLPMDCEPELLALTRAFIDHGCHFASAPGRAAGCALRIQFCQHFRIGYRHTHCKHHHGNRAGR